MTFTITDTAVFDGHVLLPGRHDVLIVGRIIAGITPTGVEEPAGQQVDGRGATLLPGLVDGHVHLLQPGDFTELLAAGVTSAADMASWPPAHAAALRAQNPGLTYRTPGAPLIGPAGPHSHMPGLGDAVIATPDLARREVAARVAQGVDHIKLVLEAEGRGGPEPDAAGSALEAAHEAGLRVVAHASSVGAIELALEIGVDILTHAPFEGDVDPGTIDRIIDDGIAVIPTLVMMRATAEQRGVPDAYDHARRFVAALHAAGAVIVAGSDANSAPGAPAAVPHRTGLHDELALLVDAGLTPAEALRAATSTAAELFAWPDRGVLSPGAVADLLLVEGDPAGRITDVDRIRRIWLDGAERPGRG